MSLTREAAEKDPESSSVLVLKSSESAGLTKLKNPSFFFELKLVWWLRLRESYSGKRGRMAFWLSVFLAWNVLLCYGAYRGYDADPKGIRDALVFVSTVTWPLWALIPLLSGGAGEVTSAQRLSPYPVSNRMHLLSAWVSALLDYPYVVAFPPVFALAVGVAGFPGAVAAVVYALGASATGQAGAWVLSRLVLGRSRPGLAIAASTLFGVVILAVTPLLVPFFKSVFSLLPGAWLGKAAAALEDNNYLLYVSWCLLLLVPVMLYLKYGIKLVEKALDVERRIVGAPTKAWGKPSWAFGKSMDLLLLFASLRSVLRATSTQAALAGVLVTPFVVSFTSLQGNPSLSTITSIAALAAAASLAVNVFAYDAGGAVWLLSTPLAPGQILRLKMLTSFLILFGIQTAAILVSLFLLRPSLLDVGVEMLAIFLRSFILSALGVRWSVTHPVSVDFDSLRNKVTTPRSALTFFGAAIFFSLVVTAPLSSPGPFSVTAPACLIMTVLVVSFYFYRSFRDLSKEGATRIAGVFTE